MNVTIRKANAADFPDILLLIKEFSVFQKAPERVTVTLQEMTAENLFQEFIVETADKEMVGFASCFFAWYSWSGKALYLNDLYISELYRKQAIGSKLFNTIIHFAKEEGCKKVRWQVSHWNHHAINFYKNTGVVMDLGEINCDLVLNRAAKPAATLDTSTRE